jgi:hypothetical protein
MNFQHFANVQSPVSRCKLQFRAMQKPVQLTSSILHTDTWLNTSHQQGAMSIKGQLVCITILTVFLHPTIFVKKQYTNFFQATAGPTKLCKYAHYIDRFNNVFGCFIILHSCTRVTLSILPTPTPLPNSTPLFRLRFPLPNFVVS